MREETLYCDICRHKTEELNDVIIPVIVGSGENKRMANYKQEICKECAQKFSDLYHDIRRKKA